MPNDDTVQKEGSVEEFSRAVAYIWAINECVAERQVGCLGEYVRSLAMWMRRTADYLDIEIIDVATLALRFFEELASNRDIAIKASTEVITLAIAVRCADLTQNDE